MKNNQFISEFPYPIQYLGSKSRISEWILDAIVNSFPGADAVLDVMAGTGVISDSAIRRGLQVAANDLQPYSYVLLKSAFSESRAGIPEVIAFLKSDRFTKFLFEHGRAKFQTLVEEEDSYLESELSQSLLKQYVQFAENHLGNPKDSDKNYDLFSTYYSDTYYGIRQCVEIDAIRQYAELCGSPIKHHLMASLISAMTNVASTTTHLAQYLKLTSNSNAVNIAQKRRKSIREWVIKCLERLLDYPYSSDCVVTNVSFEQAIPQLAHTAKKPVVYADPPYFKEHYSRYYHLLDTLVLYDYPELTWNKRLHAVTVGRYRKERLVSDFGLKSKVASAFNALFSVSNENACNVALSYAETSLLDREQIESIADKCGYSTQLITTRLRHSGQGNKNHEVNEYLFLMKREGR